MPRRVLYDAGSPAAAAAARLLDGEYDVQAWTAEAMPESVVLTSDPDLAPPAERARLIGVVDPDAPGPWPAGWYALVPTGAGRPLVTRAVTLPLDGGSVAGHVALTGAIVNLADAYEPPPGSPFKINRWFDEHAKYRTKSMLVVPMRTPQGEIIGALQLINCKPERRGPLRSMQEAEQHVRPYGDRNVRLAGSLASQAAVALANRRLYD